MTAKSNAAGQTHGSWGIAGDRGNPQQGDHGLSNAVNYGQESHMTEKVIPLADIWYAPPSPQMPTPPKTALSPNFYQSGLK